MNRCEKCILLKEQIEDLKTELAFWRQEAKLSPRNHPDLCTPPPSPLTLRSKK